MTTQAAEAATRLAVFASVASAYRSVFGRPRRFFVVAALPFIASLTVLVLYLSVWFQSAFSTIFFLALLPMLLSYLGLAWTRYSLHNRQPRFLLDRPWVVPYAKVLAYSLFWVPGAVSTLLLALFFGLLLAEPVLWGSGTISHTADLRALIVCSFIAFSPAPLAPLFLALPAIESGRPGTPLAVWRLSRGLSFRLGLAVALLTILQTILASLCFAILSAATWTVVRSALPRAVFMEPVDIIGIIYVGIVMPLWSCIGTALFAELMVIAIRSSPGWSGPRTGIIERFD